VTKVSERESRVMQHPKFGTLPKEGRGLCTGESARCCREVNPKGIGEITVTLTLCKTGKKWCDIK
jgi:hypothetical protein